MMEKIVISGCSVTAGIELWEEEHIPQYSKLSTPENQKINFSHKKGSVVFDKLNMFNTKNIKHNVSREEIVAYNKKFAYPSLLSKNLQVPVDNIAEQGISNKEIALRTLKYFPKNYYTNTIAIIQMTTHNRLMLTYSQTEAASIVLQPTQPIHFLTRAQNNILQEYFFEFFSESLTMQEDYMSILYTIHKLNLKNIICYVLPISSSKLNQPRDEYHYKVNDNITITHTDNSFELTPVENMLFDDMNQFKLLEQSLEEVSNYCYLPHYHFSHNAHKLISERISERIKCLHF